MPSKQITRGATIAGLGLLATAFVALVALDRQTGTLRAATTPWTITWLSVAFVGFLAAVWGNEGRPLSTRWIWSTAIAFRLLMLATEPTLSDDVFRYLWDGHLLTEGVNPYSHPISAASLDPYEVEVRRLANNPHLASPYLPTAQLLFALTAVALPLKAISVQLVMTILDLGTAGLLAWLLRHTGFSAHRIGLYLWHPLVIVELSHGAHLDGAMTFFAIAAFATTVDGSNKPMSSGRQLLSPILLALAVLTRPLPLLLAPVLWWRWQWWQRGFFGAAMFGMLVPFSFGQGGLGLDSPSTGTGLFGSARVYANDFRFNSGLAHWLETSLHTGSSVPTGVAAAIMVVIGLSVWLKARPDRQTSGGLASASATTSDGLISHLRLGAIPLMAYTVLTPVFHPWYLIIVLAFLPFQSPRSVEPTRRWILLAPWWTLSALLPLSYLTYQDPNRFAEREWVRLVEWLPTLALVVIVAIMFRRGAFQREAFRPGTRPGNPVVGQPDNSSTTSPIRT